MDFKKYQSIKEEYEKYYNSFLRQGKLPLGSTSKGFWGSAVTDEIFELFNKIKLKDFKNFLDLGSGDGKVVLIASLFRVNAVGIEYDKELFNKSIEMKGKFNLKCKFINSDFYYFDISKFDLIFINPDVPFEKGLERKLILEMKGKLIVYGSQFKPKLLKNEGEFYINGTLISFYSNEKS